MSVKRACPACGGSDYRKQKENDNEFVVVPRRECKACGTVYSPPVSPLLALVTVPLALVCASFAVWAVTTGANKIGDENIYYMAGFTAGCGTLVLAFSTRIILKHRNGKIHSSPKPKRDARPWDKSAD
jgi:hypothetical protein